MIKERNEQQIYRPAILVERRKKKALRRRKIILRMLVGLVTVLAICTGVFIWNYWDNASFTENIYFLTSDKVKSEVRAVLLTDLHQKSFGEGNSKLTDRIEKLAPDVILIAGDMVNKKHPDKDMAVELCRKLVEIAPVYYSLGNHENEVVYGHDMVDETMQAVDDGSGGLSQFVRDDSLLTAIEQTGATILTNKSAQLEVDGNLIEIGGINTNLSSMWNYSDDFIADFSAQNRESYKILLCHRPEVVYDYLSEMTVDLCLSGHTHGGIVRLPGIGGLYTTERGFFPELTSGLFKLDNTKLIVSRGLGGLIRVFNRPELVIIDIGKKL